MKIDAKSLNKKTGVHDQCGRLTFIAQDKVDAVQLAALFDGWQACPIPHLVACTPVAG